MSFSSQVKGISNKEYGKTTSRIAVLPVGAAIVMTANGAGSTYGSWADLVAAPTVPTLIVGVFLSAPSAADIYTVDIGLATGHTNAAGVNGAGATVIAAAHRVEVSLAYQQVTAVGVGIGSWFVPFYTPIVVPMSDGTIIGRCYGITAAAVTISARVSCLTSF